MSKFYIKQKLFTLGEQYTIKNEAEEDVYFVNGSFMKIPKTFTMMNDMKQEIAYITKKSFSFLPTFSLEVNGEHILKIKRELSFFRSRYSIEAMNIQVQGNWWDMDFSILEHDEIIGQVKKEWFTWGDSYVLDIVKEDMEEVLIALVVAINCVKSYQAASAAATY